MDGKWPVPLSSIGIRRPRREPWSREVPRPPAGPELKFSLQAPSDCDGKLKLELQHVLPAAGTYFAERLSIISLKGFSLAVIVLRGPVYLMKKLPSGVTMMAASMR